MLKQKKFPEEKGVINPWIQRAIVWSASFIVGGYDGFSVRQGDFNDFGAQLGEFPGNDGAGAHFKPAGLGKFMEIPALGHQVVKELLTKRYPLTDTFKETDDFKVGYS